MQTNFVIILNIDYWFVIPKVTLKQWELNVRNEGIYMNFIYIELICIIISVFLSKSKTWNLFEWRKIGFFLSNFFSIKQNLFFRQYSFLKGLLCTLYYLEHEITEHIIGSVLHNKFTKYYAQRMSFFKKNISLFSCL